MTPSDLYRNALAVGTVVERYRLEAVLGAGRLGITYRAWDAQLARRVALKEYLPAHMASRASDGTVVPVSADRQQDYGRGLEHFLQQARRLGCFNHPHVVHVLRDFEAYGTGYMIMDYDEGLSMTQFLQREPLPSETWLWDILMPLLDGLKAVHDAGFFHHDIKPSAILLREQGGPALINFGAAGEAAGGAAASMTLGYAPIEHYSAAGRPGAWSDIYAMSGVFYRAVTNAPPPDAVSRLREDTVTQALAAARARYGPHLLGAIAWGLEMDERRRPQSVAEWQDALRGTRVPAGPTSAATPPVRTLPDAKRRRNAGTGWPHMLRQWAAPIIGIVSAIFVVWAVRQGAAPESVPAATVPVSTQEAARREAPAQLRSIVRRDRPTRERSARPYD